MTTISPFLTSMVLTASTPRCLAEALCLAGPKPAGRTPTRPTSPTTAAARATARWPRCTGSKVPPKRAIFIWLSSLPLLKGPLLGDALHALRLLLIFSSGDGPLFGWRMLLRVRVGTDLRNDFAHRILQFRNAFSRDRRNFVHRELQLLAVLCQLGQLFRISDVNLRRPHDHRLLFQLSAKAFQLTHNDFEIRNGIRTPARVRNIDHVGQHAGTLNMPEKLDSQPGAGMRAFNQAGNIGHNVTVFVRHLADRYHAQVGLQSGEGIVGNLRLGRRDARNQG